MKNYIIFFLVLSFLIVLFTLTKPIDQRKDIEIDKEIVIDKTSYGLKGKVYYVSASGDDKNNGQNKNLPFKTLQHASNLTKPGDIVYVMNGLYQNEKDILEITRSGTESNWIMYAAFPGHKPKLKVKKGDAISTHGAEYLIIDGFEIEGNNPDVTLEYALAKKNSLANKITNSSGVSIHPDWNTTNYSHHVIVRNCHIYNFSGGGISSNRADYILIKNNIVHHNGYYCPWATSGISVYKNWNSDNYGGYKIAIRNNVIYANRNYVPFFQKQMITDGNGIIIDDTREGVRSADGKESLSAYVGRTLIENNVVYLNGGRGIHIFKSDHVDVINNTTYRNSQTERIIGDVGLSETNDVRLYNNIMYPQKNDHSVFINNVGPSVTIDYNLIYNTSNNLFPLAHNIIGLNPLFVTYKSKTELHDFRLKPDSPAIDRGHKRFAPKFDRDGTVRPVNKKFDIGAFEFTDKNTRGKIENLTGGDINKRPF
jgi:parallel beta-helix repeat protein